jgi:uncharacterized Zn ribbon protein
MGFLNVDCPNCRDEGAYHNGNGFQCPECGHTWGELNEEDFEDDFGEDEEDD